MKFPWAALLCVLALLVVAPAKADAQANPPGTSPSADSVAVLSPVTTVADRQMTFQVGDAPNCSERGRLHRVSLRIYNILAQAIAVPVLRSNETRREDGEPLENVMLTCNEYTAYWDGKNANTSENVAPGMYFYKLEVDGRPVSVRQVIIRK